MRGTGRGGEVIHVETDATSLVWQRRAPLTLVLLTMAATSAPLARLLLEPLAALGSPTADLDAALVGHAVVGRLSDHLWGRTRPDSAEVADVAAACLAVARRGEGSFRP